MLPQKRRKNSPAERSPGCLHQGTAQDGLPQGRNVVPRELQGKRSWFSALQSSTATVCEIVPSKNYSAGERFSIIACELRMGISRDQSVLSNLANIFPDEDDIPTPRWEKFWRFINKFMNHTWYVGYFDFTKKNLCRFPFPPWGPFPFRLIPYWLPPFIGRIGIRGFSRSKIVSSSEESTLQKL